MTGCSSMAPLRVSLVGLSTTQQQQQLQQQQQQHHMVSSAGPPEASMPSVVMAVNPRERQRVSRNLFGSIGAGESDRLLAEETDRSRERVRKRYGFDLATGKPCHCAPEANITTTRLPGEDDLVDTLTAAAEESTMNLLEREQAAHLAKLQQQADIVAELQVTPPQFIGTQRRCGFVQKRYGKGQPEVLTPVSHKMGHAPSVAASVVASERHNPYARQLKMTECFNQRKPAKSQRLGALMSNASANGPAAAAVQAAATEDQSSREAAVLAGSVQSSLVEAEQQQQLVEEEETATARRELEADVNEETEPATGTTQQEQSVAVDVAITSQASLAVTSSSSAPTRPVHTQT